MTTDFRALCAELLLELEHATHNDCQQDLKDRARAALAEPQPEPPTECEVTELVAWMKSQVTVHQVAQTQWAKRFVRAAELLQRQHPQPVPVSERLPGPEDCLDEGWAWFFNPRTGWRQATQPVHTGYTHWLSAHALPLPSGARAVLARWGS